MIAELSTFQKFANTNEAENFAQILAANSIYYEIENNNVFEDVIYGNVKLESRISVRIKQQDFEKATLCCDAYYSQLIENIDTNYFVFSMLDDELLNIVEQPDTWGRLNYLLAKKELDKRNKSFDVATLQKLSEDRIAALAKPEKAGLMFKVLGFAISMFVLLFSIRAAFVGLIFGWILAYSKKTLPNGSKVFMYVAPDRKIGKIMMAFAGTLLLFVTLKYFKMVFKID